MSQTATLDDVISEFLLIEIEKYERKLSRQIQKVKPSNCKELDYFFTSKNKLLEEDRT